MSRPVAYLLLAISLLFVAGGIASGASEGWAAALFFGVCAAVAVWQLWPGLLESTGMSAEDAFARYPGPVMLRVAPTTLIFLAVISAIFGGVILWMLLRESPSLVTQILLWPGVVLFLGGVPVMLALAVKGSSLRLERDGFTVKQAWRARAARWSDTSPFASAAIPPSGQVLIIYDDAAAEGKHIAGMNRAITGRNAALPDTYGLSAEDLAALMNAWRERALRGEG